MGWPGPLPQSFNNLITVIGDSFIENLMNPEKCHQSVYLKKMLPEYNFLEAARSGVSFVEAIEIFKQLDSLTPRLQLSHLHDSDFEESILQITKHSDITQFDIEKQKIVYGKMNSPGLKKVLYSWKFLYYLYQRFSLNLNKTINLENKKTSIKNNEDANYIQFYINLLEYTASLYNTANKILIFGLESSIKLVNLSKRYDFKTLHLKMDKNDKWSFDHDKHWTCHGHESVAEQVSQFIKNINLN
tara:strand:- start:5379 stop:6110 length:732 start_codon:yes stop_codon:yes gene_type:complete